MTARRTESSLYDPVSQYVRRRNFRWQHPELQFYDYSIDLYAFSRVDDLTIAVELKLLKWKRAFEQAILYQLCADLVYIAVPMTTVARIDLQLLSRHGIGLLAVDPKDRCRQVLPGARSPVLRQSYRSGFIAFVRKG